MGNIRVLDGLGMVGNPESHDPFRALPLWRIDEEEKHVTGFGNEDSAEQPDNAKRPEIRIVLNSLTADARAWSLSFCRDFRILHQLNHDHNCTGT